MISVIERLIRRRAALTVLLGVFTAFSGAGCTRPAPSSLEVMSGMTMGTTWTVKFRLPRPEGRPAPPARRAALLSAIKNELEAVNDCMSVFRPDSEISRFNRFRPGEWFPVSPELAVLAQQALDVHRLSKGALDITLGPVIRLWGFGPGGGRRIPGEAEIHAALARTGSRYLDVRLDPPALRKRIPGLECNLSSLAKGYGVDRLVLLLKARGARDILVEIGGEVRVLGQRPGGGPWKIGVMKPEATGGLQRVIALRDCAMATSGDYENFFEVDGVRYSHTMDPRTGKPVTHDLASVTVVADTCMKADALATALLVSGPRKAREMAEADSLAVFLIRRTAAGYREYMSPAFRRLLHRGHGGE